MKRVEGKAALFQVPACGSLFLAFALVATGCGSAPSVGPYARPAAETGWENGGFVTVTPEPVPPALSEIDQTVTEAIWRTLREDPTLAGVVDDLEVEVTRGVVHLEGTVPSARLRQAIVENIRPLPGVSRIENELNVSE